MKQILILIITINIIFSLKVLKHECEHDKIRKSMEKHYAESEQDFVNGRNLQNKPARNMVISYDFTYFNKLSNSQSDQIFKQSCEKAIKLAIDYFSRLIKIVPKSLNDMKWNYSNNNCGDLARVTQNDRDVGKDSDLHLYITFSNEGDSGALAYAGWCRFLPKLGPTHGMVNFNLATLNRYKFDDNQQFEDLMEIVIHEMSHVMGFSGHDVENWVDANKNPHVNPTVQFMSPRGGSQTLLRTPNVLAHTRQYYACGDAAGMPFENQGGSGSAGSHWETSAIQDEYMNAAISQTQAYFSKFTTALLRDTGYYAEINAAMEEKTFFGEGEGCSFLYAKCDLNKREFCQPNKPRGCDYYYHGTSQCGSNSFTDPGCNIYRPFSNSLCVDVTSTFNAKDQRLIYGYEFGPSSKCFLGNILQNGYQARKDDDLDGGCYRYQCVGKNAVNIFVSGVQVNCTKNLEFKTVAGYSGKIQCPEKIEEFCSYKKFCPNNCSTKGYCINERCYCLQGFAGADCSQKV